MRLVRIVVGTGRPLPVCFDFHPTDSLSRGSYQRAELGRDAVTSFSITV
jgi:hypothetical protein